MRRRLVEGAVSEKARKMAHLRLQNANDAKARKCERLNRTQLAPASRVDAQIAIHVDSGTTCRSSACFGPAGRGQTAGKPGHAHARRVARSAEHLGGRRRPAVGGRRPAGGGRRSAVGAGFVPARYSVSAHFQFQSQNIDKNSPPPEIRGYKLKGILKYIIISQD